MSAYSIATRGLAGRKIPQGVLAAINTLLFGSGEQGAWYDPSDLTTLFQDSAGTTPVTAVEQPVGLMLDKSRGSVLGPELVTGGGFDDPANWTTSTWTVSAGVATYHDTINDFIRPANANLLPLVAGKTYCVRFTLSGVTGSATCAVTNADGSVAYTAITSFTTNGEKQFIIYAANSTTNIRFYGYTSSGGTWSLDNISVRELPGNHASQATSAKRPKYSRRVNLLTKTETFSDALWVQANVSVSDNAILAPDGTLTADKIIANTVTGGHQLLQNISLTAGVSYLMTFRVKIAEVRYIVLRFFSGGAWASNYFVYFDLLLGVVKSIGGTGVTPTISSIENGFVKIGMQRTADATGLGACGILLSADGTTTSYSGNNVDGLYMWGADIRPIIDAHLPYQWVNTDTDYDADPAKFPAYLRFDGVDDALQTGNIDFTGTDKMTVWAGVTKLSDAARGTLMALGIGDGAGSVLLQAPYGTASPSYLMQSTGSTSRWAASTAYPSPSMAVLTGISDIPGDSVSLRVNASVVATTTTDQGIGNYGSYPLYIGGQGGTSAFFNGRLYSLIVRGAQSSQSQIEACELYVKQKMRLP